MLDKRGNPTSTASGEALAHAERALWQMMSFYGTPFDALDAALAVDPAWALPKLMKAGFLASLTEPGLLDAARSELASAESASIHMNQRERDHLAALRTLLAGDWHGACRDWEALLLQHPCDALALQWAHLFDFYRGDAPNLRQRIARVLPQWADDDPLLPYVLGQYAFGLEENQRYEEAEAIGRRALAGPARVPWAIHAVAHVMEMQGRHEEGSAWMVRWQPDWTDGNGFAGHLGWHQALFALETLDHAEALRCFDAHLAAAAEQITLQRLDAAALLWRLHLLGVDAAPRWQQLASGWQLDARHAGFYAFNDLHALLALIGSGDIAGAEAWARQCALAAEASTGSNRETAREVGAPLMRGMLAFARGRCDDAIEALYPARAKAQRFGGSHAQRDLIDQTLLAAAAAASGGHRAVGRALLNERRLAKPATPLTDFWAGRLGLRHTAPK